MARFTIPCSGSPKPVTVLAAEKTRASLAGQLFPSQDAPMRAWRWMRQESYMYALEVME
jgi:hypothetical protein